MGNDRITDNSVPSQITRDESKATCFSANGRIERVNDTTLLISELPIRKWTQDYKTFLEKLLVGDGKVADIKDFRENHTDTTVSFTIVCTKEKIDEFEADKNGLMGKFKLTASLNSSNMNLFDEHGRITKYADPRDILSAFYSLRLDYYEKRKEMLLQKLRLEQRKLSNKVRIDHCGYPLWEDAQPYSSVHFIGPIYRGSLLRGVGRQQSKTKRDSLRVEGKRIRSILPGKDEPGRNRRS